MSVVWWVANQWALALMCMLYMIPGIPVGRWILKICKKSCQTVKWYEQDDYYNRRPLDIPRVVHWDAYEQFWSTVAAFFCALLWPVLGVGLAFHWAVSYKNFTPQDLEIMNAAQAVKIKELEQTQEARIQKLEKELDML